MSGAARLSGGARDFVAAAPLRERATPAPVDPGAVRAALAKALDKHPLTVDEAARLLHVRDPALEEELFAAARALKERVYGDRIVLFAPLYVGNLCRNDCTYCAFRVSNRAAERRTLTDAELRAEVRALTAAGHKRLILVFGEHPRYDPAFIAETVRTVYATKGLAAAPADDPAAACASPAAGPRHGRDRHEIRRVNINAAPLDHEGYRVVKDAGIGTYQIFQETYDHDVYARVHPRRTRKADYLWRLDGPARAIEAGCDDVGIGVLYGLADWRFETLALVAHANDLRDRYGVGPHTVSFPRLRPASGVALDPARLVSDAAFRRLVAVLRLAIPYTGLILTAREPAALRREMLSLGVSQIDAGSRIELGGYASGADGECLEREQFSLADTRPLDEVMRELLAEGSIPSFCTACYRLGRTGEHFMEFAVPGFIKRYCTPNALLTLTEYLVDHASPETRAVGERLVAERLTRLEDGPIRRRLEEALRQVRETDTRDIRF